MNNQTKLIFYLIFYKTLEVIGIAFIIISFYNLFAYKIKHDIMITIGIGLFTTSNIFIFGNKLRNP